jgi:hypothetical protein
MVLSVDVALGKELVEDVDMAAVRHPVRGSRAFLR